MSDNNKKPEIKIKKNQKVEAFNRAPDELIARAIHDALVIEHEKKAKIDLDKEK